MANRVFQSLIHQMRDAIGRSLGVIDEQGNIIACSELGKIGETLQNTAAVFQDNEPHILGGCTFISFGTSHKNEYAVFVEGNDAKAESCTRILCVSLENIKANYDEKYDRCSFIKNIILENILPGDIYSKSRELRLNNDAARAVLLVRVSDKNEASVFDTVKVLFPDKAKDFVISLNETDTVIVKEVKAGTDMKDLEKLARSVADTIGADLYAHALVGIGNIVSNVKDLSYSFKEAQVALEVGKVFDTEKSIVSYNDLGIARLIYQLPTTLCETFLGEIFKYGSIDALDNETLFTIQKFFENSLNVSETSRKLFVHRNTLVYRLDKILKITGLDLREFDQAIVFKIALMVKKYLDSNPSKF